MRIHQVISALTEQIQHAPEGTLRLTLPFAGLPEASVPDWLEAQPLFPKLYWQSRDGLEEVVVLGQQAVFTDLVSAESQLSETQRVWGCKAFDDSGDAARSSYFFLPEIELIRQGQQWSLSVNLNAGKAAALEALSRLVAEAPGLPAIDTHLRSVRHTPNPSHWHQLVTEVLSDVASGQVGKVVLARQTTVRVSQPVLATQLLKASGQANVGSFHFLFALNAQHAFIGATPERLYLQEGCQVQTEALAGTIGRGRNPAQDQKLAQWLSFDGKNRQENQYVVDDILARLTPLAAHLTVETAASLIRLRQVQHLKRPIQARLKPGVNGAAVLEALHATAAVAGWPRSSALAFLQQHEPFDRGWYAGSLGYFSHQKAEFCVAIRSAEVTGEHLKFFAGAGIVPGSDAASEWQELNQKLSTLMSLLDDPARVLNELEVA
ncbi:isochorismate synthase MenF [Photobacterium sp. 1_MG-2023]|uniref:isochorismate synthase n=1 Tax=Photobacterium sp. 1_MG-2023 TaxID=3062646 RepID=UPI0026E3E014|nr:isochorismate synthase [Photobacterium sp. 1_MG-2023]MDO6707194.1 isochorismate synthase [Photobacterium sp. 1_MG-2023]